MSRLFLLTIAAILAFMFWKIIRIVMHSGGRSRPGVDVQTPSRQSETFHDVRDASFQDLQGREKDGPGRTPPSP
jgi:hypothetical protein